MGFDAFVASRVRGVSRETAGLVVGALRAHGRGLVNCRVVARRFGFSARDVGLVLSSLRSAGAASVVSRSRWRVDLDALCEVVS